MTLYKNPPIIALLTDFGLQDHFVGVMKAVIAKICPNAQMIDISHDVAPQSLINGAFLLQVSRPYFPTGTIFLCVIDPGVGTERRAVIIRANSSWFVGPDNGILFPEWDNREPSAEDTVVNLDNPNFWQPAISHTFHGRDIFAPIAAHLAAGVGAQDMGATTSGLTSMSLPKPKSIDEHATQLEILHIDRFGNLVTNLPSEELPKSLKHPTFLVGDSTAVGVQANFVSNDDLIAIAGSSGYIELAVPQGSAANKCAAEIGSTVLLTIGQSP